MAKDWLHQQAELTLTRLIPRLTPYLASLSPSEQVLFFERLQTQTPIILSSLMTLYGSQYDFFYHLEQILITAMSYYVARSSELKALDQQREADRHWFQSEQMVGAMCYVDLFAGDLAGIADKIPYFEELGITYLHLMPLFRSPEANSDGGYAISSYREVDPRLGTTPQLADLASALRAKGISLVIDFVYNHTSDEHEWALKALAGDENYQDYYYMFPDRTLPDQYEPYLREIFPDQAPGSFTYMPQIERWVWTTFNSFQWDLNYRNPNVFREMLGELLFLANVGIEVLRFDAVAFTWKELGTSCENLPQAHTLIQAMYALAQVVAPALEFKSEAIVHPDEVVRYFGAGKECRISYHPLLMVLLWDALATRKVNMLYHAMEKRFTIHPDCAWVNYVRCHDDIGWGFADEDAGELGIHGYDHRQFLNAFYTGRFEGSFARGLPFNYNPVSGDARISGTAASLCGLESALEHDDPNEIAVAVRRILLIHSIIMSMGGLPLLYLNDEIGTLNDYSYENDPAKAADNRWMHRPTTDWERMEKRHDANTTEGRIYQGLRRLIQLRKSLPALGGQHTRFIPTDNPHVFAYMREHGQRVLVIANFSEQPQTVDERLLAIVGLSLNVVDLISEVAPTQTLAPYQFQWITKKI
ncbi:MAG: alpha-glucosidase C-terminal domain-containing protein [Anaerolineales bacterium]|nr:alpha-glucosidase C-terminal domain-containing protein [Anaerolineales bacterium]